MMIIVEFYVGPGFDADALLSEEARRETEARVLTRREAESAGLAGLPEAQPDHGEPRYLLVSARHRRWIERALEADAHVTGFNVYDIGA